MKTTKLPSLAAALITPLLTQCVIEEGGSAAAPTAAVPGSAMQSNQVYDLGLEKGFADGRDGQSRNPLRHNGTYPPPEAINFNRGYEIGYNKGSAAQERN